MEKYIELLDLKKQIILQGPPGTGKTYTAKDIAEQMIFGEITSKKKDQKNRLEKTDQFKLIQFHPAYSYEDFVRGITAKPKGEFVEYKSENKTLGIFAAEAYRNYLDSQKDTEILSKEQCVVPKKIIHDISEDLLETFAKLKLIDQYDVYQRLMDYWADTMQDDIYAIADDGWMTGADVYRITKNTKGKNDKVTVKEMEGMDGIESKLIKPNLIINRYFIAEQEAIDNLETEKESIAAQLDEMEEGHGAEDGLMADAKTDKDKIAAAGVKDRMKKIKGSKDDKEEYDLLKTWLDLTDKKTDIPKQITTLKKELEVFVWDRYKTLMEDEIKTIVVNDKWMQTLDDAIHTEMQRISQRLTHRIKELVERYETPLPLQINEAKILEEKVNRHLAMMGFTV